jgi:CRISPR/Cas system-associated exonuclease Cas4 (RecB family)
MPEARPVVKLHTIEQWFQLDQPVRVEILRNIKLKERLQRFLLQQNLPGHGEHVDGPQWVRCSLCHESPHPGYVLVEPRYDGIHPSSIAGECLYKIYLDMVGAPSVEQTEPRERITFDFGKKIHELFQDYGRRGAWGPHYTKEVEVSAEFQELAAVLMLEGHADADNILVIDDIPGAPIFEVGIVHEYKSKKTELFSKLTRPQPEHKQQAMIYAAALNRPVVCYLYINKNDANLADFPVEFDPAIWQVVRGKIETIKQFYDRGEPAPANLGYHCGDCKYKNSCSHYLEDCARRRGRR